MWLVGVGGQGVVSAAQTLAEGALRASVPVVVTEMHGMAQRGGAVEARVRLGSEHLCGPTQRPPEFVVALELLEALRVLPHLARYTRAIVDRHISPPPSASLRRLAVPSAAAIESELRQRLTEVAAVDAHAVAREVGIAGVAGVVLLGALCRHAALGVPTDAVRAAVGDRCPEAHRAGNLRAFDMGASWAAR